MLVLFALVLVTLLMMLVLCVMVGIELVATPGTRNGYGPAERTGHRVAMAARRRGVIVRPLGNVLVLMPPLAIADDEVDLLVDVTREAIHEVTDA